MIQMTVPKPDMSWRRNRSLAVVMNSQNQRMKMNTAKASATKTANADSPKTDMVLPFRRRHQEGRLYDGSPGTPERAIPGLVPVSQSAAPPHRSYASMTVSHSHCLRLPYRTYG